MNWYWIRNELLEKENGILCFRVKKRTKLVRFGSFLGQVWAFALRRDKSFLLICDNCVCIHVVLLLNLNFVAELVQILSF